MMSKEKNLKVKGIVFDIQRCSIHDGPGIRTTVFLKGCPLSCKWCHNPESWSFNPELMFNQHKCISCLDCIDSCPVQAHTVVDNQHFFNRDLCIACGNCVKSCFNDALEIKGKKMQVAQVLEEVKKDLEYYQSSGGGLTLSGGEALVQFEFTYALLTEAKKLGIHNCIETSGFLQQKYLKEILSVTDLFLFDYKATDDELHQELTGVSNKMILENLDYLYQQGANIILRCPLIPGVNDSEKHLRGIALVAEKYPSLKGIEIMAYHNLGVEKNIRLGREANYQEKDNTDQEQKERWLAALKKYGCKKVKIG